MATAAVEIQTRRFGTDLTNAKTRGRHYKARAELLQKAAKVRSPPAALGLEPIATLPDVAMEKFVDQLVSEESVSKRSFKYSRSFLLQFKETCTQKPPGFGGDSAFEQPVIPNTPTTPSTPSAAPLAWPRTPSAAIPSSPSFPRTPSSPTDRTTTSSPLAFSSGFSPLITAPFIPDTAEISAHQIPIFAFLDPSSPLCGSPTGGRLYFGDKPEKPKERETDPNRIAGRERQIAFGKQTPGYLRYRELVPKKKRAHDDPRTPDKSQKCSKRGWDGQIRRWRKELHRFDPPELAGTIDVEEEEVAMELEGMNVSDDGASQ